jgi:NAD(P)-dependent dehydrogenase (short-subunit alcohol dehydrogenase family)
MELNLAGKVVIVGGASKGIGRAIALGFAQEGANLVLFSRHKDALEKVAAKAESFGVRALCVKVDVSRQADVDRMVGEALKAFGKIDILINNAAIATLKRFADMDKKDWDMDINIILYGMLYSVRAIMGHMISNKSGKIINVGSDAGSVGEPYQPIYSAAKAGVVAFTKAFAKDVARYGVLVNTVSAALTDTEGATRFIGGDRNRLFDKKMLKDYCVRRPAKPEEIADMVIFVASDRANFITGQTIHVNGGYYMPN